MGEARSICVFLGSHRAPAFDAAAARLGEVIARRGDRLVYGGASVGLMGVLADAALAGGAEVEGVIPGGLFDVEVAHTGITRLHETATMRERKQRMYDLSDVFVAFPGGIGTLDETFEAMTWSALGIHAKPLGFLDVDGFWQPLLDCVRPATACSHPPSASDAIVVIRRRSRRDHVDRAARRGATCPASRAPGARRRCARRADGARRG